MSKKAEFTFTDEDVKSIVDIIKKKNGINITIPNSLFHVESLESRVRFNNRRDNIYRIKVEGKTISTLPDFLKNLRNILGYFVNVARLEANSENDYVRIYFSNAPRTAFSTEVMRVSDLSVQGLLKVFEHNMQSNAAQILDNDWECNVSLFIFSSDYSKKNRKRKNFKNAYKYLNKGGDEKGGSNNKKSNKIPRKHGRDVRGGVFQIQCDDLNRTVKGCCLPVALLVGKSILNNDDISRKILSNLNKSVDEYFTADDVLSVYQQAGVAPGPVKVSDLKFFYDGYLKKYNIDLVVFSKTYFDSIIYDSRIDDSGELTRFTDNVIFLWLNENHFDLILNVKEFSRHNLSHFCFKCMSYYSSYEYVDSHICKKNTCLKCFSSNDCAKNTNLKCNICNIIFYNDNCYHNHLVNRIFRGRQSNLSAPNNKLTPCQYMFFCNTCYKTVPRFQFIKKNKTVNHNCNKVYCKHCNKYLDKNHQCYIKPLKIQTDKDYPTLFYFDFETQINREKRMVPFYCVVQKVCLRCDQIPFNKTCEDFVPNIENPIEDISIQETDCCGVRQYIFEDNNCDITGKIVDFMLEQKNST